MKKVKVFKHETTSIEIDEEYPFYLHYQDDDHNDVWYKIDENCTVKVSCGFHGNFIGLDKSFCLHESYLRLKTTESEFKEAFRMVSQTIFNRVPSIF